MLALARIRAAQLASQELAASWQGSLKLASQELAASWQGSPR